MTENRCIEVLKKMKHMFTETCAKIDENTALDMAVEAIKEIQQYRAIETELREQYHANVNIKMLMQHFIETIFKGEKHEGFCILTNEDAKMWDAYKAIGTVEQIKAIKALCEKQEKLISAKNKQLADYEAIGTIEEFKVLKEKSEPKGPIIIDNRLNEIEWKCPVCGLNVIEEPPCQEYCQRCGNKLDWSE